ncbi:MAG: DUF1572 family protein [Saprospiraceae bacterium]|nr:DUF1572 family protein [Saprospiraceae bacterium]
MILLPSWRDIVVTQGKIRIGDESIPRILKCLDMLDENQVWAKYNENSNSIGHLILHLEGNASQWILSTLGTLPDARDRESEFNTTAILPVPELKSRLLALKEKLNQCFDELSEQSLLDVHPVQCYEESGISIVIHVIEHFSYHTGQIAFITKMLTDSQTGFYADANLNQTN